MRELLEHLQQRSLLLSEGDLRRMVQALSRERDIWQAAGACERPFPHFVALLETLRDLSLIHI